MRQIAVTKRDIGRGLDPVPRNGGRGVFRGGGNSGDDPSTCSDKYCDGQGGDGSTHEELRCPGSAPGRPANEGGTSSHAGPLNPSTVRAFAGSRSTARCFGIRRTPGRHGIAPARGLCTMAGRRIGPQRRSAARRRLIEEDVACVRAKPCRFESGGCQSDEAWAFGASTLSPFGRFRPCVVDVKNEWSV